MQTPSPERWQRIEALIDAALDLPAGEREAWLRAECGEDADLLRAVLELLEAGERTDAFLNEPVIALAAGPDPNAASAGHTPRSAPLRVGPYRVVRELGRGGMGTVYLAERDEHFQQTVALKVVRRGLHLDEHLVRRFVDERQLLASLEHANIARLLDGGVTEEDVPWFAMEFVEGEPIDRWCDARRLSVEARLELFCTVCEAVEYAHRRQIVHRDLKPSNILVRHDGTVKLLDFGVAKLIAPDHAPDEPLTRTGMRLLTPEYASPEQVRGEAVTSASDVYSLAVLLYELLTGRRPYRVTTRTGSEVERAVLTQAPVRPSTVVRRDGESAAAHEAASSSQPSSITQLARARGTTPDRLSARLRGELDGIVLQALSKEPKQRYTSADAFARDVRRHLEGTPVAARMRSRARLAALASVAALTVLAAAAGIWRMTSERAAVPASPDAPMLAIGLISDYRPVGGAEMARPLADLLATNLARVPGMRIVSTARLYELMAQLGAGSDIDAGAYSAAARRAGASMLVDGSLYAVESGGLRLDIRRIDVSTGGVLSAHTVSGQNIFALVDSGTTRLAADIGAAAPGGSIADVTTHSEVAYRFYVEGLRAYYRGDALAARGLLQAALTEDSTLAMAAYYLARSHVSGELNIQWMRRALELSAHASDRERLIIRTAWAVWTSDPTAVMSAETLTVRYPQEMEGHFYAAQALAEAGDVSAALARFRYIVAADSLALEGIAGRCAACDARSQIIDQYVAMDSIGKAEQEARLWTELQPNRSTPWLRLAQMQAVLGKSDEARRAYQRAAQIDPTLNAQPEFLATRLLSGGDFEALDRELREIIQSGSPDRQLDARWYLIISLRYQGRFQEALQEAMAWRPAAARANPSAPPAWFARHQAQVLLELGRAREAAALFDSIAAVGFAYSPSHQARHRTWDLSLAGSALAAAGDTSGLAARIDTVRLIGAQSLLARDPLLHHYLRGLLFAARGDDEDAQAELKRSMFSPAGHTRANYELARALLRLGRAREAVGVLQPTVRTTLAGSNLYATRTELHELLAQAWEAVGVRDSALAHYRRVVQAWQRPDPILRERAEAARTRLRQLEAERAR